MSPPSEAPNDRPFPEEDDERMQDENEVEMQGEGEDDEWDKDCYDPLDCDLDDHIDLDANTTAMDQNKMEWHSHNTPTPFPPPPSPFAPIPTEYSSKEPTRGHLSNPRGSNPGANSTRSHPCAEEERRLLESAAPGRSHRVPLLPLPPATHSVQILKLASPHPAPLVIEYAVTTRRDGEEAEWKFKDDRVNNASMLLLHMCRESRDLMLRDGLGWVYLQDREEDQRLFNFEEALMVWTMSARVENSSVELVGSQGLAMPLAIPQDAPLGAIMADRVRNLGICEELWFSWPFAETDRSAGSDSFKRHATDLWKERVIARMDNLETFTMLTNELMGKARRERLARRVKTRFLYVLDAADDPREPPDVDVVAMEDIYRGI